ncbi:hypothetical protein [Prosthecobacter sp.]|uniref:hypothetical protein n=1 Tax=Prosthecobacter sp. TaxID=1965333 RepID=UPI0037846B7B
MTVYIPSGLAVSLCERLLDLAHPPGPRRAAETQRAFALFTDVHGDCWLEIDTRFSIVIHLDAELGGVSGLMRPWLDEGLLPEAALSDLLGLLDARRGLRLVVHEALPLNFRDLAKTREQMMDAGLLPVPAEHGSKRDTEEMVTLTLLTVP